MTLRIYVALETYGDRRHTRQQSLHAHRQHIMRYEISTSDHPSSPRFCPSCPICRHFQLRDTGTRGDRSSSCVGMPSRQSRVRLGELDRQRSWQHFNLVIPLLEGLLRQTVPALGSINRVGCLKGDIKIATFDRKFEPCVLVLHELQSNLLWSQEECEGRYFMRNSPQGNPSSANRQ
jgi:hypothetical protein